MWKEILKGRGLIDPEKIKDALNFEREPRFAGSKGQIPKFYRHGEESEYANLTDSNLLDVEFEGREIRVKGDITVDGETISFTASQRLPKPLAAMSNLPYNLRPFQISSIDIPKKLLEDDKEGDFEYEIRQFIGDNLAEYFNGFFRYFEKDLKYEYPNFFRTSEGLRSGKEDDYGNVRYDRRSKQQSFKDVLRKPDSSNVREFNEVMSDAYKYIKALPVTKLKALIKRGIVKEIENPEEEYKYQVLKRNHMIDGMPIVLFFDEALWSGGEEYVFEVTDDQGTYDLNLYARFDFDDVNRSNITSKERQKLIDNAKKFMKMSPESIIEAILRS
jgi:hypothetical protein